METAERIVEAYVRYVKHWATIANIKCANNQEIDLLAIGPAPDERYHIEVCGSADPSFRTLGGRGLAEFITKKFHSPPVAKRLAEYGFCEGTYKKLIVHWDWAPEAEAAAGENGVTLWSLPALLAEMACLVSKRTEAFPDDTLRTLQILHRAGVLAIGKEDAKEK